MMDGELLAESRPPLELPGVSERLAVHRARLLLRLAVGKYAQAVAKECLYDEEVFREAADEAWLIVRRAEELLVRVSTDFCPSCKPLILDGD